MHARGPQNVSSARNYMDGPKCYLIKIHLVVFPSGFSAANQINFCLLTGMTSVISQLTGNNAFRIYTTWE